MEGKIFNNKAVLKIDKGEEVIEKLSEFLIYNNIKLASISGLGASNNITVGLFNTETKVYQNKKYTGEFEITNFTGNVTTKDGEMYLHMHITFSDEENRAYGGHLNQCYISGACELFIDIYEGVVEREFNKEIGLNILKFI